jgi:Protein of unknown function (DUF2971)
MAALDPPVLPSFLYRYRRISNAQELQQELVAIRERHLYFASYRALNDSMEGFYEPTTRVENNSRYAAIVKQIVREKSGTGICCFSDIHDSELMWAHYARNYRGICIGYSPKKLIDGLSQDYHLVRVSYGLDPPLITSADAKDARCAARKILSHKKASWVYEREWRIIGPKGIVPIESEGSIRDIFVGSKLERELRSELMLGLKGVPISINLMNVSGYSHDWKEDRKGNRIS